MQSPYTIEVLDDSNMNNLSDDNLKNLVRVLGQLSTVNITDYDALRKYIKLNNQSTFNKKISN